MSMFQRRHYNAIARLLREASIDHEYMGEALDALAKLRNDFALMFMRDNPSFDAGRFDKESRP